MLLETRSFFDGGDSDSEPLTEAMTEDANSEAGAMCDRIAREMWEDDLHILHDRGIDIADPLDDDDFNEFDDNNSWFVFDTSQIARMQTISYHVVKIGTQYKHRYKNGKEAYKM